MTRRELPTTHDVIVYIHNEFVKRIEDLVKEFNVSMPIKLK